MKDLRKLKLVRNRQVGDQARLYTFLLLFFRVYYPLSTVILIGIPGACPSVMRLTITNEIISSHHTRVCGDVGGLASGASGTTVWKLQATISTTRFWVCSDLSCQVILGQQGERVIDVRPQIFGSNKLVVYA